MPVQMELKRIIISDHQEQQIIVLQEFEGDRAFPIVIGLFEATSIDRRVRNLFSPRPLTHDLIVKAIEQFGGEDPVIIRPASETRHERIIEVLNAAAAAGVKNLTFS